MDKKKSNLTSEERRLFRQNIKGIKSLKQDKMLIKKEINPISIKKTPEPEIYSPDAFKYSSSNLLETLAPHEWLNANDYIHFAREGIQKRTLSKLHKGQLSIEARLDLHRLSGDEALATITQFIERCLYENHRFVLIIHGKGQISSDRGPILKNVLNLWLRQQPYVLAFATSKPKDGGTGAMYVLLKSGSK